MKKTSLGIFLILALLLSSLMLPVSAGSYDGVFTGATFSVFAEYSEGDVGTYEMRGFAASPDGKYLYAGCLQGDKRVLKIDAASGAVVGEYSDSEPGYPKGLFVDDRGYLYVGIAVQSNDGSVKYAIVNADTMQEEYAEEIAIEGRVGINGATAKKIGDKYYLYFVTNYGPNYIYCYDVTDVKNPVLNQNVGEGGIVDLAAMLGGTEGSYIAVDSSGYIYLSYNNGGGSKGDTLYKLSPDGKSVVTQTAITEAYGVHLINDEYVLVSTYDKENSAVYVLNAGDLSQVAKIGSMDGSNYYSMAALGGDKIYVSDQGYSGNGDRILVSSVLAIPAPAAEVVVEEVEEAAEAAEAAEEEPAAPAEEAEPQPEVAPPPPVNVPSPNSGDATLFAFALIALAGAAFVGAKKIKAR